ncbi:aminopeptidase [Candidatus Peregrinibacteria bacterium]|nr:aminopeptidase [Candidatus Peregrinibacteria bacterium]
MKISFKKTINSNEKILIIPLSSKKNAPDYIKKWLDLRIKNKEFALKNYQQIEYYSDKEDNPDYSIIIGMGDASKISSKKVRNAFSKAVKNAKKVKKQEISILLNNELAPYYRQIAEASVLANYQMDIYKTGKNKKVSDQSRFKKINFISENFTSNQKKDLEAGYLTALAVNHVRDYVNGPENIMNVNFFANEAKKLAKKYKYKLTVLEKKQLERLGMGAILGVNRGSEHGAKLLILEHRPLKKEKPIMIAGKGVTFDTGGVQVKPDMAMDWMKMDMAGGGVVLGLFHLLKELNIKKNVIGIIPLTDNAVSSTAQKPNDIVTSYSGKTIEIGHTDAEGRLILADAISYGIKKYQPQEIIDLATLTGACMVALGTEYAGLFSNNKKLIQKLLNASENTDEEIWHMPIHKNHREAMKGTISDLKNIASSKFGGASTAAAFLQAFVEKTPWAHIDIAGVAKPIKPKSFDEDGSATGFGVRLIIDFLQNN